MKNSSLQVLVRPPHCKSSVSFPPLDEKKKEPGESRLLPARTDPLEEGSFNLVLSAPTTSRAVCSCQCEEKRNATETDAARRAERTRAGQNMEWSGCDFSCLHPGARGVLDSCASLVMSATAH